MNAGNELQAFQDAALALWNAHQRHADNMAAKILARIPQSRRALYNALKAYRRSETDLHRAVIGEAGHGEGENLSQN